MLPTEVCRDPSSAKPSTPFNLSKEEEGFMDLEVEKLLRKGGYRGGRTLQKLVSCKYLNNTQEGWREEVGGRHEGPEHFHRTSSFQNRRSSYLPSILQRGDFMCKIDLQDAYQKIQGFS